MVESAVPGGMASPDGRVEWRVDRRMTVLKAVAAVVFVVAAVVFGGDPAGAILAIVVAVGLAGFALRDVIAPVRLAADGHGVTVVTGFAARRQIPWSQVERVRVDTRKRLGRRAELLEIDADDVLHLFSATELSAPCDEVAAALSTLRTGR